jgi:hypothetical protein
MKQQNLAGKILRFTAVVLLGLTASFHLLGGIGTSCVALFAERWDSMAALAPYKWLYLIFVLVTVAVSIFSIQATVWFAKGKGGAYRYAVLILIVDLFVTAAHVVASKALRGSAAPANVRLYLNIFTLAYFLVIGSPRLLPSRPLGDHPGRSGGTSLGPAFIIMGLALLTVQWWAGPTHTWADGINYADVWHGQLMAAGWVLVTVGGVIGLRKSIKVTLAGLQEDVDRRFKPDVS